MELIKPRLPDRHLFVEIGSVARIREGINYTMAFGEPVRITSQAGFGKTTGLYYLAEDMGGYYCQIGQAHKSAPDMYRTLLAACEIYHDDKYTRELFNTLVDVLGRRNIWRMEHSEKGRLLIIVDEVQTLEATALRELLSIQETCQFGLVISGNGERIAKTKMDRGAWEQIDSRIGMEIKLPGLSRTDCELMGAAYGVEGMDAYQALANFGTKTTPRMLGRLLENAKRLTAGTGSIQLRHIQITMAGNPKLGDAGLLKSEAA